MERTFANARRLQIAFAVLLIVCVAQLGWWLIDQWLLAAEVQQRTEARHQQSIEAAELMLERGVSPEAVESVFPDLLAADGADGLRVQPDVLAAVEDERWSRVNQYAWEGGFFFVVLLAAIVVLWQALRTEARLRRRQNNFVAAVTHELKSPLAAMRLSAETLDFREADADTRQRLIRRLLVSLDRMETTVTNVLDTARIDEDKLTLAPENVDLVATIRDLVDSLENTAQSRGIDLGIEAPRHVMVLADRHALGSVLRNLVDNAFGAVSETPNAKVTIAVDGDGSQARIEVRDNGRGFDPEDAAKLFDKFYRPGDEMRREGRGTGLGLYIARTIAGGSGATLSAHSEGRGSGAVFRILWPLAPEAGQTEEASP